MSHPPGEDNNSTSHIIDAYSAVNTHTNGILSLATEQASLRTSADDESTQRLIGRRGEAVAGLADATLRLFELSADHDIPWEGLAEQLEARGESLAVIPDRLVNQYQAIGRSAIRTVRLPEASREAALHELTDVTWRFAARSLNEATRTIPIPAGVIAGPRARSIAPKRVDPRRPFSFERPQEAIDFLAAMPPPPPEKVAVRVVPTKDYEQVMPHLQAAGNNNMLLRSHQRGGFFSVGKDRETGEKLVWLGDGNTENLLIPEFGSESPDRGLNNNIIDNLAESLRDVGPRSKNILITQGDPQAGPITFHYYFRTRYPIGMTEQEFQERYDPSRYTGRRATDGEQPRLGLPFSGGSPLMERARQEPQILDDPRVLKQVLAEITREETSFDLRLPAGNNLTDEIYANPYKLDQVLFNSDVGYNKLILDSDNNRRSGMLQRANDLLYIHLPSPKAIRSLVPKTDNARSAWFESHFEMGDVYESIGVALHNALLTRDGGGVEPSSSPWTWAYKQPVRVGLYRKTYRLETPEVLPIDRQRETRRKRGGWRGHREMDLPQQPKQAAKRTAVIKPADSHMNAILLRYPVRPRDNRIA